MTKNVLIKVEELPINMEHITNTQECIKNIQVSSNFYNISFTTSG